MDTQLFKAIESEVPKFNPTIAKGLVVEQVKYAEQFIERTLYSAQSRFPEGLTFKTLERCTPQEQWQEIARKRGGTRTYEVAHSDLYLVKLIFDFKGEEIKRFLFLPFVKPGGIITLRGSTFAISPVLADKALSVGTDTIFLPMSMAKIKFEKAVQHYLADGKHVSGYVIWSMLYNRSAESLRSEGRPSVQANTTMVHYLFCKFGVKETFKRFFETDVVIGHDEITAEKYPADKWIILRSTKIKPKKLKERYYVGSDIAIAIPREQYNSNTIGAITGFFYVVDHFPNRVKAEYLHGEDELRLWKVLLGKLIFPAGVNEGKLITDINTHFISLDGYLDDQVRDNLRDDGIMCEDIYDLFIYIILNFADRTAKSVNDVNSMYGKRLTVLRYILYDITSHIFKFMFKLTNNTQKQLTKENIIDAMNFNLRPDLIMRLNHRHGEVASISVPGDNMVFKVTSNLVMQTDSSGLGSRSKGNMHDPTKMLHSSIAEIGSYLHLPKSEPTGRGRINPFIEINDDGLVERRERYRALLDEIQRKINR